MNWDFLRSHMCYPALVGRNFVSGICKLKPKKCFKKNKNLKPNFLLKNLGFYQP